MCSGLDSARPDTFPLLRAERSNLKQGMRSLRKRGTRDDEPLRHFNLPSDIGNNFSAYSFLSFRAKSRKDKKHFSKNFYYKSYEASRPLSEEFFRDRFKIFRNDLFN